MTFGGVDEGQVTISGTKNAGPFTVSLRPGASFGGSPSDLLQLSASFNCPSELQP